MKIEVYKSLLDNLTVGFALMKIRRDQDGKHLDYQFIEINSAFEELSGCDRASLTGRKISDLIRQNQGFIFNCSKVFENLSLNTDAKDFQHYIEHLNKWLKVNITITENDHLITLVTDITEEIEDLEEKRSLLTLTQDIVFELDAQYIFREIITADESLLFLPRKSILGKGINELFPSELAQGFIDVFQRVTWSGKKEKMKYRSFTEGKWYEATIIFHKAKPNDSKFVVSIQDITKQKQVEDELVSKTEELERFFQISPDLLSIVDFEGRFLKANDAWEKLLGFTKEELQTKTIFDFIHPDDIEETLRSRSKLRENEEIPYFINKYLSKDGSYRYIEWHSQPDGPHIFSAARDITDRKESADKIQYLSFNDQLTGLYNRRFYEEEQRRLDVPRNLPISIILGDLDGLKLANDTFGHFVGDELLKKAAHVMKKTCRADEIICRMGGDEFVIILPNADQAQAKILVDRLTKATEGENVGLIDLSISFGWSTKEDEGECLSETLIRAEELMYQRKSSVREKNKFKSIDKLLRGLFESSPVEESHAHRVSQLCGQIGEKLDFRSFDLEVLKNAGRLHDIGKVTVNEGILNKRESLDKAEQTELRHHPETAYRILNSGSVTAELARYVLYHHERWDGLGYPHGLKGEEIPIQSRIIAAAEAYEVMTSERPYRKAMSKEEAIEELKRHAGTQFDPRIVEVFIEILENSNHF